MKNKLKFLFTFVFCGIILCGMFLFTGCKNDEESTDAQIRQVYELAVSNGYDGSYEEWLASIKGEKGDKGDKGETGEKGDKGETGEKGDKGDNGSQGLPGADGREVEFRNNTTHIQWRYVGEETWRDLIALDDIKGEKGDKGEAGEKGETGEKGDKGETGDKGEDGLDGIITYEEYCLAKPNYRKTKKQWVNDLLAGRLAPINESNSNYGDLNSDGKISNYDALLIGAIIKGSLPLDTEMMAKADVDLNGVIDIRDTVAVMYSSVNPLVLPITNLYGDVNLDGVVDEADYNFIADEEAYNNFTVLQTVLAEFGYGYSRERALYLLRQYLDGEIPSMDEQYHFITLDFNGYETTEQNQYVIKNYIYFKLPTLTREGYKFLGWCRNGDSSNIIDSVQFDDFDVEMENNYVAQWEEIV